jgi:hypothetical protein
MLKYNKIKVLFNLSNRNTFIKKLMDFKVHNVHKYAYTIKFGLKTYIYHPSGAESEKCRD